jgi:hypothetical protein
MRSATAATSAANAGSLPTLLRATVYAPCCASLRVETEVFRKGGKLKSREQRYFVSSLPRFRLTSQHWLLVIRRHWGVETTHQILDTAFAEDDHPWIVPSLNFAEGPPPTSRADAQT